jgi:hypothetical protein
MNGAGTTTEVEVVQVSHARDRVRIGLLRTDPAEARAKVRHLVIFSAPIVGCARPVAGGS